MALTITVRGAYKLRALAVRLDAYGDGRKLRVKLGKALRKAAEPTVRDVRQAARDIRTTGLPKADRRHAFRGAGGAGGIRERIANAVTLEVKVSQADPLVRFRVNSGKLPAVDAVMPRKFDDGGTFRHPVMGDRDVWVGQTADPWFFPPIQKNIRLFRAEIDRVLGEVAAEIERG